MSPRVGSDRLERLLALPRAERIKLIRSTPPAEQQRLLYSWEGLWARPEQVWRPGPERDTFYLAGRGWGKSRTGAEAVRWIVDHPDLCGGEIAIAGRTATARNADMIHAPGSGLMSVFPPGETPIHKTRRNIEEITFPGRPHVRARLMSGDVPASFRGPNFGFAWTDELPHWPKAAESWEQMLYTLRAGEFPRTVNTTTPLPKIDFLGLIFKLDEHKRPILDPDHPTGFQVLEDVRVIVGSSYDNAANLAPSYVRKTLRRLEASQLGRQEIHGGILLDVAGAIWTYSDFRHAEDAPALERVAIGVDPAGSRSRKSAETGIIGAGWAGKRGYMLRDRSGQYAPRKWAEIVIDLYDELHADAVVVETNFGRDMVASNVLTVAELADVRRRREERGTCRPIRIEEVDAHHSKGERARTVRPLWEQGAITHCGDPRQWVPFEHQLTHFDPNLPSAGQRSDRMDAGVHVVRWLIAHKGRPSRSVAPAANHDFWAQVRDAVLS